MVFEPIHKTLPRTKNGDEENTEAFHFPVLQWFTFTLLPRLRLSIPLINSRSCGWDLLQEHRYILCTPYLCNFGR